MTAAVVLALGAAVAYGVSDFVGGLLSRRASVWSIALTGQLGGAATIALLALALPGSPAPAHFAWAGFAGFGSAVGTAFLYRGLARGRMGVVAPISAVGAALVPIAIGVTTGERPHALVWVGIATALPGIWLVARVAEATGPRARDTGAIIDGVLAGLGFGVLFAAVAQVPESAGVLPIAANHLLAAVFTVGMASVLRQAWLPRTASAWSGVPAGIIGALGTASFLGASQHGDLSISAVLASLYPAVTIALAATVLRERVMPAQLLGLILCTTAVGMVTAA